MNEFLEQFVLEAHELCEQATAELLALEAAPDDGHIIDAAFRAFHTLKGGAGIVGFTAMARAVHEGEDALSAVRSGDLQITSSLIGDCLSCVDQVSEWLEQIKASGDLPPAPDRAADAVIARFSAARPSTTTMPGTVPPPSLGTVARAILEEQLLLIDDKEQLGLEGRLASVARVTESVFRQTGLGSPILGDVPREAESVANAIRLALGDAFSPKPDVATPSKADAAARVLRVEAGRIDSLVNLTGEIIVAKNAIAHIAKQAQDGGSAIAGQLRQEHARLESLTTRLQDAVLGLRVLPLRTVFQRFSRIIRELAVDLNKSASLVTQGDDTEADKMIVELLFEPLLHVVRNAMDHGIETPQQRTALGKPVVATIRLRAFRQEEHVVVEVSDDGAGVDLGRVKRVALERGVSTEDALAAMDDQDVLNLVFAPGFSTAIEVTNLSGRGVGMDAVRTAVERIGGRVSITSDPGLGSIVRFTLPFSIMMTRVMTVEAGGQFFGIPLDAVIETARLPRERIQAIGAIAAFVLHNRTIPLIDLVEMLGQRHGPSSSGEIVVVIAQVGSELAGLAVDRLGERMDVMLKPIDGLLAGTPGIAGTTLMGDGRVLLILDLAALLG
jgi:two-component system chemotaxis sensor kinase CheA